MAASRSACFLVLWLLSGVGAGCDRSPRPQPWPVHWDNSALAAVVADYVRALPLDPTTQVVRVTQTAECTPTAVVQVEASITHPYSAFYASGPRPVGYAVQDGTLLVFYDERPGAPPVDVDVEPALTALIQQRHLRLQRDLARLYCPPRRFPQTTRSPGCASSRGFGWFGGNGAAAGRCGVAKRIFAGRTMPLACISPVFTY